ncbi:glycerophosphodiester phosphodiesterase family protein [Gammaproteobacteria bacterium]|nr:glycerophosphodiester phosphodiesterase family protein [Gammaproteobacteria bacterium]
MKNSYQKDPFIGLSHRGNSKKYIENSFEAFNSVIQMGYKYIETDLRMTLDKEVIAFHDPDLKRLFNLDLQVKDLTFNEIASLFKEKNCNLLTLKDALRKFPRIHFNIDLKVEAVIQDSIKVVTDLNAFDRVCFASFYSSRTRKVLRHNQNAIVSMGMTDVALFKFFKLIDKNIKIIQIPLKWKGIKILTRNLIKKADKSNLLVHVWTINDRETINNLIDLGVNGIVTDEPELLMEIMKERDLISN